MIKTLCTYTLCGCFIRLVIEWEYRDQFIMARDRLAKALGAEFLYSEDTQ